jgi:hypothetical protein
MRWLGRCARALLLLLLLLLTGAPWAFAARPSLLLLVPLPTCPFAEAAMRVNWYSAGAATPAALTAVCLAAVNGLFVLALSAAAEPVAAIGAVGMLLALRVKADDLEARCCPASGDACCRELLLLRVLPPTAVPAVAFCAAALWDASIPEGARPVGEQSKEELSMRALLGLLLVLALTPSACWPASSSLSRVSSPSNAPTSAWLMEPTSLDPMLCAVPGVVGCAASVPGCARPRWTASCAKGLLRPVAAAGLGELLRRAAVGLSGQGWVEYVSEGMPRPAASALDEVTRPTSNRTTPTLRPGAAHRTVQAANMVMCNRPFLYSGSSVVASCELLCSMRCYGVQGQQLLAGRSTCAGLLTRPVPGLCNFLTHLCGQPSVLMR